jgi:hypothetical protein
MQRPYLDISDIPVPPEQGLTCAGGNHSVDTRHDDVEEGDKFGVVLGAD